MDLNSILSFGASDDAEKFGRMATAQYGNLDLPKLQELQLEKLVQQGAITPEEAQAYLIENSAMNAISLDPKLQKAQMDALQSLQDISSGGGLTDMDRAQLAKIQADESTQARGARERIMQNAQERGVGGSGLEMLARLQNEQESASRRSARDTEVAGMAQQRALQALQQAGQLGGQMQQSDFARQAQIAEANDAIKKFNAQNQQQVGMQNIQARNQAQAQNLAERQRVADANVQLQNQQQQYNKGLAQQNFENQYKIAQGKASALASQAQAAGQESQGNKQLLGGLIGAGATVMASDERVKKDVTKFDAAEFLDSIIPSKYRYKEPEKNGYGVHASPMAQDLEKTDVGRSMVEDTEDGKQVDYGKGFGAILASLADVHNRLKKIEG